jgi:aminotransferase in exopolysaccharide biosynthesis
MSCANESDAILTAEIIDAIQAVCGPPPVALHEPRFRGNEWEYVKDCIDSTFVSSVGEYVNQFESQLAEFTGAKHAVAVVNGTAALHLALLCAGVRKDDEVLVPALTFVATANAVKYCGAIPHFVDSEEVSLGMDPVALRVWLKDVTEMREGVSVNKVTGRPVRAMVPMHTFGHPCNLEGLRSIAQDFAIVLVEDAAESLGSYYQGRHTGTFGMLGVLSFNGNKILTTGGGGAILTNDSTLAAKAKHLSTTAKLPHKWEFNHDQIGFNYRMPNINAALGCAQLEGLPSFIDSKRKLFLAYNDAFKNIKNLHIVREPLNSKSNYWLQAILLNESIAHLRYEILSKTNDFGFMTRPAWTPMHTLIPFVECPRSPLPIAESLVNRIINIPSSAGIC